MNIDRGKESFTEDEIEAVRVRLLEHKAFEALSFPALARRVGDVADSTLNLFATRKYAGDNAKVAWLVNRYLMAEEAKEQSALTAPVVPGYRVTRTSRLMIAQLRWAHGGEMAAIVGNPGLGKTATIDQYCATNPNAFKATIEPATRSVQPMLCELLRACGAQGKSAHASTLVQTLRHRLEGINALLVVDEAQHLTDVSLDQLRSLHDRLGCGIVLAGNATVLTRVQGAARSAEFAQLSSRVSWSHHYDKPHADDVDMLCEAWVVEHQKEREFIHRVASLPGALRSMTQVLKMATLQASATEEPRTLSHLQSAWKQMQQRPSGGSSGA